MYQEVLIFNDSRVGCRKLNLKKSTNCKGEKLKKNKAGYLLKKTRPMVTEIWLSS